MSRRCQPSPAAIRSPAPELVMQPPLDMVASSRPRAAGSSRRCRGRPSPLSSARRSRIIAAAASRAVDDRRDHARHQQHDHRHPGSRSPWRCAGPSGTACAGRAPRGVDDQDVVVASRLDLVEQQAPRPFDQDSVAATSSSAGPGPEGTVVAGDRDDDQPAVDHLAGLDRAPDQPDLGGMITSATPPSGESSPSVRPAGSARHPRPVRGRRRTGAPPPRRRGS